jgi:DNA-binding MarR family transcriptional regulator
MLDEIDLEILATVSRFPHSPKADILKLCSIDRDRTTLGRRIDALAQACLVLQDKTRERGRVFVSITPEGERLLAEGKP